MSKRALAVIVHGAKNSTIVDGPHEVGASGEERLLAALAKSVAGKDPTRTYYVVAVRPSLTTGRSRKGDPLYVWHVPAGFKHAEGWWISVDEDD